MLMGSIQEQNVLNGTNGIPVLSVSNGDPTFHPGNIVSALLKGICSLLSIYYHIKFVFK